MQKWKALYQTKANRNSGYFTTLKLYSMKPHGQALLCSKVVKHESGGDTGQIYFRSNRKRKNHGVIEPKNFATKLENNA